ncbi:pentapeptide repeat-containing protein, partial [Methylobacterium hispanicum]
MEPPRLVQWPGLPSVPYFEAICQVRSFGEEHSMVAIRDKSGRVLAEGAHPSVRDLLVEAVARNRRLPGADLAGLDLSGLDLRRACLPDARLDGANLRQTRFDGASLSRASLANVSAQGAGFA